MSATVYSWVAVGVLAVSALITTGMGVYAYWHRERPGARWLSGTLWATTVWTGTYALGLLTHNQTWRPFWEHLQWFATPVLPVCFLLFALEYSGYGQAVTRKRVLGLFVLPAITIVFVWTNDIHNLMWIENQVVVKDGIVTMVATYGPWFWVTLVYSYILVLLGGGVLLRLLFASNYLYTDQAILLGIGIIVPLVGNIFAVFVSTPVPGFDLTPYGFAVWGIALFGIVYRRRLFSLIPATQRLGRKNAISQLDDGVIIIDDDKRVVYLNNTAASVFDCTTTEAIDTPLASLVPEFEFETVTTAKLERNQRRYEIRVSPITNQADQQIGYTLIVTDVTERYRREQALAEKREELARVNELNETIRGVNRALVKSTEKTEVYESVCTQFANRELYEAVCLADALTVLDETDNWIMGGERCVSPPILAAQPVIDSQEPTTVTVEDMDRSGTWIVVPVVHDQTVYGVFCALTSLDSPPEDEYDILLELGELIGYTLNALEHQQLLSARTVSEFTLKAHNGGAALATASEQSGCRFMLQGLIPSSETATVAFLEVSNGTVGTAREALLNVCDSSVRTIRSDDEDVGGVLSWTIDDGTLLEELNTASTNITKVVADGGTAEYSVEMPSDQNARQLLDRIQSSFPGTSISSKCQKQRGIDRSLTDPRKNEILETVTERQEQMLKAAFHGGYFDWPRESTAEEIADTFEISAATFHGHLRKAERSVFRQIFDDDTERE
ncbi:histidine kinase N-terminal 7TM domain-containing protein [Halovenus marina]|uniref:histidine kinase N-terminal 7TM domain-containing protein n=1 Tax=Halovenus marina TaxID=3396621 RepID=UPI003F565FC3